MEETKIKYLLKTNNGEIKNQIFIEIDPNTTKGFLLIKPYRQS